MQDGRRLASYYSFMGTFSWLQTIHHIVDHEGSWGVLLESDYHGRSLVHCASAGGRFRVFWRFLASLHDHIRDHLHITLSKSDWQGAMPVEYSTKQDDPSGLRFFHDIGISLLAMGRRRSLLDLAAMGGHVAQFRYLLAMLGLEAQISRSMLISATSGSNEQVTIMITGLILDSRIWNPELVCDERNALTAAIECGHVHLVQNLCDHFPGLVSTRSGGSHSWWRSIKDDLTL
jgi:hypothetical protein